MSKRLGDLYSERLKAAIAEVGDLSDLNPTYICAYCEDMGVVSVPGDGDKVNRLVPCPNPDCPKGNEQRRTMWERRYNKAGLLPEYRGLTFATFDLLSDKDIANKLLGRWAASLFVERPDHYFSEVELYTAMGLTPPHDASKYKKNCIVFTGEPGVGKTGFVAATINRDFELGRQPLYIRALDIIKSIQDRYNAEEPPTVGDIVRDFQTAPLLYVDEMTIYNSERPDRLEKMEDIFRYRMGAGMPTLVTTNHTQAEFVKAWGIRTADVLDEKAHWIEVGGERLRQTRKTMKGI